MNQLTQLLHPPSLNHLEKSLKRFFSKLKMWCGYEVEAGIMTLSEVQIILYLLELVLGYQMAISLLGANKMV